MKFYRYEILTEDITGARDTSYGIAIGTSLGDAADRVADSFSNDIDHEVIHVKVELLAPDEGVLLLDKDLIDKIAEEVIW